MERLRYRTFGPLGSSIEVLVGLCIVTSSFPAEPEEPTAVTVVSTTIGGLVIAIGVVGLALAARGLVRRRSSQRRSVTRP